jgi:dTDP-4-amino-4,6-dideoxygalactose transaminase
MKYDIPFVNLQAQYLSIKPEIDDAVHRVLTSGRYVLGEEVAAFEWEFAAYCGVAFGIAVNSGTSALHLSLLSLGIGHGDEVVTSPMTFVATAAVIMYTGARPVFADIEANTCTIDPSKVESAISERTKAIIPVHLYGQSADMSPLIEIARRHRLAVIEDACQAHGAAYEGRRAGSLGNLGCFSFYPTKNLGSIGEGGMVVTDREDLAASIRELRDWGTTHRYQHRRLGFNYRMDAIQAAVLRVKLRSLDRWNGARRALAAEYIDALKSSNLQLPSEAAGRRHVYHVFSIRSEQRDRLQRQMAEGGIETGIHYPVPVHLQEGYRQLAYNVGAFPISEHVARTSLSLPLYPELRSADVIRITDVCRQVVGNAPSGSKR